MKRIILFRYHNVDPAVVLERIVLLKKINPQISIYGLYGGIESSFYYYRFLLDSHVAHNYCIKNKTDEWKWKNVDIAVLLWYNEIGRNLDFEMLHIIEWDVLILDSIDKLYRTIPQNGIGLTGLKELSKLFGKWYWVRDIYQCEQWNNLLQYVQTKFNYKNIPFGSQGPGACLPKSFLEGLSSIEIPELCNDEIRLPLFGQILGYNLYDTGFLNNWFETSEMNYFNCNKRQINAHLINEELSLKNGRRFFHPYYETVL